MMKSNEQFLVGSLCGQLLAHDAQETRSFFAYWEGVEPQKAHIILIPGMCFTVCLGFWSEVLYICALWNMDS